LLWLRCAGVGSSARPAQALLVNYLYFVPLAAGLCAWSACLTLSKATWAGRLETLLLKGPGFALPSIIALGGLLVLNRRIGFGAAALPGGIWLAPVFLLERDAVALILFWIIAVVFSRQRLSGRGGRTAGVLSVLYVTVFSLVGIDGAMSLTAPWKSTVYGLYFAITGLYGAIAAWTLLCACSPQATKKQLHDLGKILVGMSLLSAYLMASQILTIWYVNLPAETGFLIDRIRTMPWRAVTVILVASVYLGPFVVLLPAPYKRNRWLLGTVAALVLCGLWLERFWLVAPARCAVPVIGLPEIAMTGAFLGALGIAFELTTPKVTDFPESAGNLNPPEGSGL
jgi:hypothetical protein